jgi:hypothetical protein
MDPATLALVATILGIIDKILSLQLALPLDVRTKQAEEFQADIDWWRTVLHLSVPAVPAVAVKAA